MDNSLHQNRIGVLRRSRIGGLALVASLAVASPAFAHAFLKRADPPVGATVHAPHDLQLSFTEKVEPVFCRVTVQAADGKTVTTGPLHGADADQQLVVTLPVLPPGTYTVTWHATSVDTHKTEGSFHFTVAP
jgi:hypothetical protein